MKNTEKKAISAKKFKMKNLAIVGWLIALFMLTSAGVALVQESHIIITPNRFVVLDDPNAGTKSAGFYDPTNVRGGSWGTNYWSGESTTIRAAAQVLDAGGKPQSGVVVSFRLKNPGTTIKNTAQSTTDSKGIAYYSFDLNEQKYWGYWVIEANATVSGVNTVNTTSFALYWWGCAQCHGNENPGKWGSRYTPKSYYTMGYDFHKSQQKSKHTDAMAKGACIICHQMYNGTPMNWRFTDNTPTINPDTEYSPDWHYGKKKCQDCHAGSNISITPQGKNPEIAGCYDTSGCHAKKNTNLTGINSTTGYVSGGSYRTNYSYVPANAAKAHNSSIPCIVCHNVGHKISKPYNTSETTNSFTEYQQCTACHQAYSQHNNSVNCTVCHSQDAHVIKVFSQSASYISSGATNPARGNCTNCHQNSSFFGALISKPKAGSYAGKNPALISMTLNHSNDPIAGTKWNLTPGYWMQDNQLSACVYCHGDAKHRIDALGKPSTFAGGNIINATISSGTWCSSCHWQGYSNYSDMISAFESESRAVPPEITGNASYAPLAVSGYVNHSTYGKADSSCRGCHGGSKTYITEFMHDVSVGTGGETCIECHGTNYTDASPSVARTFVNISAFNESIHQNINSTPPATLNNVDCWSCHYNKDMQRENVKKCGDCHRKPKQWHGNANVTTNLSELW